MTDALVYENFIRESFQLPNRPSVGRHGDPAGLADTDHFTPSNLDECKAGVAYAICIHRSVLTNVVQVNHTLLQAPYARLLTRALSARSLADLLAVIADTDQETNKYIHMRKGIWLNVTTGQPI